MHLRPFRWALDDRPEIDGEIRREQRSDRGKRRAEHETSFRSSEIHCEPLGDRASPIVLEYGCDESLALRERTFHRFEHLNDAERVFGTSGVGTWARVRIEDEYVLESGIFRGEPFERDLAAEAMTEHGLCFRVELACELHDIVRCLGERVRPHRIEGISMPSEVDENSRPGRAHLDELSRNGPEIGFGAKNAMKKNDAFLGIFRRIRRDEDVMGESHASWRSTFVSWTRFGARDEYDTLRSCRENLMTSSPSYVSPRVSIIVPVFNTEKYVEECIQSVRAQLDGDIECIVIDDGSTDASLDKVRLAIGDDPRFLVVSQENAGHSAARNHGLRLAKGEYVLFLDSDDLLPPSAIRDFLLTADETNADIVTGIAESFRGTRRWINAQMNELTELVGTYRSVREVPELARDASPCNKVIRRSLIAKHGLEFPLGIPVREDLHFVLRAYSYARWISISNTIVYYYRLRDQGDQPSHTQRVDDEVLLGLVRVHRELSEFLKEHDLDVLQESMTVGLLGNVLYRLKPYLQGEPRDDVLGQVTEMMRGASDAEIEGLPGTDDRVLSALMSADRIDFAKEFATDGLTPGLLGRIVIEGAHLDERLTKYLLFYQQRWIERLRRTKVLKPIDVRRELRRITNERAKRILKPLPTRKAVGREVKIALARAHARVEGHVAKPIWVIGERRGLSAEDTGFHLFRYIRLHRNDVECYFITKNDAKFANQARELGNVLQFGSAESFRRIIQASVLCYSDSCLDFAHKWNRIAPHLSKHGIGCFLQHGVIGLHGMRGFYHRENMLSRGEVVDAFVVSSKREAALVNEHLGHPMDNILVTGLSRLDALKRGPAGSRQILFMPTWRAWLRGAQGVSFFESDYFLKIQDFVASERLARLLKEHRMTMVLCQHFAMGGSKSRVVRSANDAITIVDSSTVRVQDLVRDSDLMISDYSSVTHDFAYQERPVVYWMFDRERFYRQSGPLLDPETELPGRVVSSSGEVLDALEHYAKTEFRVEDVYASRRDSIFDFRDGGACERIFLELDRRSRQRA